MIGVLVVRALNFGAADGDMIVLSDADIPKIDSLKASQRLSSVIQIPTITVAPGDPREGLEGPWNDLHTFLETTYPLVHARLKKTIVADHTLIFKWTGSNPDLAPILMMAHQDVVPVNMGTETDWTAPPFEGRIVDGYIYGRGTIDNKGSLIALMEGATAALETGFTPERTIYLMFGHDEEVSGSGAQAGVRWFQDRCIRMEMVLDEGFLIIEDFPLTGGRAGLIGVSEKGYMTVRVTSTAVGGHSSTPPRSSAAVQLAKAIQALDENQMPANFSQPPISTMIEATASDMPFMQRMAFANRWLFGGMIEGQFSKDGASNALIRTTTAPTVLVGSAKENVLPQKAFALVNFRVHPNNTVEDVLAHVRSVIADIDGVSADLNEGGGISSEASPVSPTDNRPYAVLKAVAARTGEGAPVAPGLVLGATDARWTTVISDNVYRFAPMIMTREDLQGFHGTNERVSVENIGAVE